MTALWDRDTPQALLLAAGLGSRLGANTREKPKCLVEVAGRPILSRLLDELKLRGVDRLIVVVGYLSEQIEAHVRRYCPEMALYFVHNDDFATTGSARSLELGLGAVLPDLDVLIAEADVVLELGILRQLIAAVSEEEETDAVTLVSRHDPALSGTFALIENGRVSAWCHESVRDTSFPLERSFKTVNFTVIRGGGAVRSLRTRLASLQRDSGPNVPLEYVMASLIESGWVIAPVQTDPFRWYEVDTPEDLAVAERLFEHVGGWPTTTSLTGRSG